MDHIGVFLAFLARTDNAFSVLLDCRPVVACSLDFLSHRHWALVASTQSLVDLCQHSVDLVCYYALGYRMTEVFFL